MVSNEYGELISGDMTFYFDRWIKINSRESGWCEDLAQYIDIKESECDLLVVVPASTYPIAMAVSSKDFLYDIPEQERGLIKQTFCDTFCKFAEYAQMIGMEAKSDCLRAGIPFSSFCPHQIIAGAYPCFAERSMVSRADSY